MESRSRYKEPEFKALQKSVQALDQKTFSERADTIKELQNLTSAVEDSKILLGSFIFHSEKIYRQYLILSPRGGFFNAGSRLYQELILLLQDTPETPLLDQQKLTYLLHYYEYKKTRRLKTELKDTCTLDDEFKPIVDSILNRIPDLKSTITKKPSLDFIQSEMAEILKQYENQCKKRYFNPNEVHKKLSLFITFLLTPTAEKVFLSLSQAKNKEDSLFRQLKYTVFYGALLYTMLCIEKKYEGTSALLSCPSDSDLYRFCREGLGGISDSRDVPDIIKLNCFTDLKRFIVISVSTPSIIKELNNFVVYPGRVLGIFSPTYFIDAKDFLESRANYIEELMKSESFICNCAKSAVAYGLLVATGASCFEIAAAGYSMGVGNGILVTIGSKLGSLFINGPLGPYIGAQIAAKYEKDAVVSALAGALIFTMNYFRDWMNGKKSSLDDFAASNQFRAELKEEVASSLVYCTEEARRLEKQIILYRAITKLPSTKISGDIKKRVDKAILKPAEERQFRMKL